VGINRFEGLCGNVKVSAGRGSRLIFPFLSHGVV